jgi:ketosteroid isomerase-like protein
MKNLSFFFSASVVSLFLSSCGPVNSEKSPDIQTSTPTFDKQWATSFIDSVNAKISEQFSAGDSAALASHYWPDAELLLSNSEAIKGNDILPAWGAMTRMGIKEFTFSTTDIKGDSEFIIETGTYEMKDEKKTIVDKGKYVVVWQQRNGEWKLYRDIGNTSLPVSK